MTKYTGIRDLLLKEPLYRQMDKEDVLSKQQFVLFRIFSLTGAIVSMAVFLKMVVMFETLSLLPWILPVISLIMLVNFYTVKRTDRLRRPYYIVLLSAFLLLHIVSYSTGGIRSASIIYHSVVILYSFMLLGRKGGMQFSVLFSFQVIYIFLVTRYTHLTSFAFLNNDTAHIEEDFLFNAVFSFFLILAHSNYLNSGRNIVIGKITEQRDELSKKNKLLSRSNINLEKVNQELDKFAYVVSHDLKAPLRAIGALTGIIKQDNSATLTPEVTEQLDLIQQRVVRLESLINGILKYSKTSRSIEAVMPTSIDELLKATIDLLDAGKYCEVDCQGKLPLCSVSPIKMQQVFLNIIENAIRHCDKTTPVVKIECRLYESHLHFCIADNGPGIAPAYHEKVFVIFQTLKPRDSFESMGVGLSIVKRIIDDAGGKIWITENETGGSCFQFTWPVEEISTQQQQEKSLATVN